jgi:UDP-N-acetylmuramyl tripeptide synthase
VDSRRLTGPNLLWDRPGAVIDAGVDDADADRLLEAWAHAARRMLDAVGWRDEDVRSRKFPGGVSVAISAPLDALYAATEVNEWAWSTAQAEIACEPPPAFGVNSERLTQLIHRENNPGVLALAAEAGARGLLFLADDETISLGAGSGAQSWPRHALPAPGEVDWSRIHTQPIALVTGCNGKTTTTRLLAAIGTAAGRVTGMTTTDGISIAGTIIDSGDFAGPGGARTVLRDPRVELAILETARGGILRRGLAVTRADAAIVTNIADDHLGEFGVCDLATLTATKLVVSRVLGASGRLVLNADDPSLVEGSAGVSAPIVWFSLTPDNAVVSKHVAAGGTAVVLDGEVIRLLVGKDATAVERVGNIPITVSGKARHNVANALGAVAVAWSLGIGVEAIAGGLRAFQGAANDNPGRLNRFDLGGVTAIVDFAHNPHGLKALMDLGASLPAGRRLVLLGQAGDRNDEAIRDLARVAWAIRPDHVIAKEMEAYTRGRPVGEIPGLLADEMRRLGASADAVSQAPSELEGVRQALEWARAGDLLLLTVHGQRAEVLALLDNLHRRGWRPGHSTR